MKLAKTLGILAVIGLVLFGLIQLIPYGHNHTNPPVVQEPNWDAQTRAIAEKACFDCHSNATSWPWYSNIAPVSWLVYHDVQEGRSHLNFSDWANKGLSTSMIESMLLSGEMPPFQYKFMHPAAKLTDSEKQTLIQGLER